MLLELKFIRSSLGDGGPGQGSTASGRGSAQRMWCFSSSQRAGSPEIMDVVERTPSPTQRAVSAIAGDQSAVAQMVRLPKSS